MSLKTPNNWTQVTLGDVVRKVESNLKSPKTSEYERYLKVEHLDADSLKIRRWGEMSDGMLPPTFYKVFKKGQILYPTRNPHLRRTAYADFDGICGEKTLTLEPQKGLDKNLFPFVFQQEQLIRYATRMMIGSTNPHIRWRDLARFRFALPSMSKQKKIGEILWALENSIWAYESALKKIRNLLWATFNHDFIPENLPNNWKTLSVNQIAIEIKQTSSSPHMYLKYLGLENLDSGRWISSSYSNSVDFLSNCYIFHKGDLLYGKLRPNLDKCVIATHDGVCTTEIMVLRANHYTSNQFLHYYFHSRSFIHFNAHRSYGTKMPRTNFKILSKFEIPLPPKEEQAKLLRKMETIRNIEVETAAHIEVLQRLKRRLMDSLLK